MRPNLRDLIIDAALRLLYRTGPHSISQNTTAEEAGLTRQGLLYHFPNRAALSRATHRRLSEDLALRLARAAEQPAPHASISERAHAYANACADRRTFAELQLLAADDFGTPSALAWRNALAQWTPKPVAAAHCEGSTALLLASLAAEGLLVHERLHGKPLAPAELTDAIQMISELAQYGADQSAEPGSGPVSNGPDRDSTRQTETSSP